MDEILSLLLLTIKVNFPDADITLSKHGDGYRVSQMTRDDLSRPSKRTAPIVIRLNEDFNTSELSKRPLTEIHKELSAFISRKCALSTPRTTDNPNQSHTLDEWIFPPEC